MEKQKEASYNVNDPAWIGRPIPKLPEDKNIAELVTDSAKKWPEKTALFCYGKEMAYGELDDLISRLASALINDFGINKGDRVATMMPNCIQHSIAYFGITRSGAVNTPINVMYTEREIEYQIKDAGVDTIIILDVFLPLIQKVKENTSLKNIIITNFRDFTASDADIPAFLDSKKEEIKGTHDLLEVLNKATSKLPEIKISTRWDLAQILYTAGTTGVPKGVMISHFLAWSSIMTLGAAMEVDENVVNLQLMPMFHCSGFTLLQEPTLAAGGTVVHLPLFRDPKEVLDLILTHKANILLAPPTFYIALLSVPEIANADLSFLRISISCGAHTPIPIIKKWHDLTGLTLKDGLGLTELNCGGNISGGCVNFFPKKYKADKLGLPITAIKIVDDKGNIVPRGEPGEILHLWAGNCLRGYWNKPEETIAAWADDGWFYSGDIGYMDEDGFTTFVDRAKDIVVSSGYNVAPAEVEDQILKFPGVAEVAVIGTSDPYRGESLKACVVLQEEKKGKVTEEEIVAFCKDKLATFKVPKQVEFIEALPKNAVGKVLRRELRDKESKANNT